MFYKICQERTCIFKVLNLRIFNIWKLRKQKDLVHYLDMSKYFFDLSWIQLVEDTQDTQKKKFLNLVWVTQDSETSLFGYLSTNWSQNFQINPIKIKIKIKTTLRIYLIIPICWHFDFIDNFFVGRCFFFQMLFFPHNFLFSSLTQSNLHHFNKSG